MVQRTARQVGNLDRLCVDLRRTGFVVEAQQAISVSDVQIVADQGHAERRVEVLQKHRAGLGHAVVIGVAQQGDAVRAWHAGTGFAHDFLHHPAANTAAVIRFRWRVGFRHQYVTVGQHVEPAWVIEAFGKCSHLRTGCGGRFATCRPADRWAMFTVGIRVLFGSGSFGDGPVPSETCRLEDSPQAASPPARAMTRASRVLRIADLPYECMLNHREPCAPDGSTAIRGPL